MELDIIFDDITCLKEVFNLRAVAPFTETETVLFLQGYMDKNRNWLKTKEQTAGFINYLIQHNFPKQAAKADKTGPERNKVRRFFEKRYNIILSKQMQRNQLVDRSLFEFNGIVKHLP